VAEKQPRLGILGGSFDPPHVAHMALAGAALVELDLDEVRWIPAGQPWQKARAVTAANHREAMVGLAIAVEPRFVLDRIELERHGPSYTVDTVRALAPLGELFLIIGADQYAGLHTWHGWQELLGRVTLAVANRPGEHPTAHPEVRQLAHRVVPLPMLDISATDIRSRVARGLPIEGMVPPSVAGYISRHGLYTGS
jgi:nicotinate-nucleotide adenylyltransferase